MGCSIKAVHEDEEEYEWLCKNYGEKCQYRHGSPDCYGTHARDLQRRARLEHEAEVRTRLGSKVEEINSSMGKVSSPTNRDNTQKESMMTGFQFPGANKFVDRMFRKADGIVWDLMTGKVGVATSDGIATIEGEGDDARITVNVMDDFGVALPAFAQSTPPDAIKVGDIIYRGKRDTVSFVIEKKENGKFRVMNVDGTSSTWTAPKVQMLGFDSGVMVLRSLVSMLPNGNDGLGQMQGNLLPMIMMAGGPDGLDMEKILPLMLMTQSGAAGTGGMGNMMQTMLMMQMFSGKGGKSPFFKD